ncbi:phytoene/squalene synthase family protein [Kutzneria viridogrisea]|uniref:Phytoene synthase n=1 Tax=Kutzneria viridogrisea TaxID=47990 RepID=A0ABR6BK15_9PSEU|nr:phytoene synthase [Kutzneria viridogrisea]
MDLDLAYARCRELNARHGRTFFLASLMLPAPQRPAVHALYGFARLADEVVDEMAADRGPAERSAELDRLEQQLKRGLAGEPPTHPVLAALVDTIGRYRIDTVLFEDFLSSMRMDLHHTDYASYAELAVYMRGSAEVIGLQLLPVIGTVGPRELAEPHAAAMGEAFQLTNFLRDVAEDLDRGRVYLPADELAAFGVDRELLQWCRDRRGSDPRVRRAIAHLAARARSVYRTAEAGLPLLAPTARPCVATALTLYRGILDQIAAAGHEVFRGRAAVPPHRRLAVALPAFARAWAAR